MDASVYCTDFALACKATNWLVWFVWFVSFVWLNKLNLKNEINQIDQINQTNQMNPLGLGLAGRLCLFSLEFGPSVIETLCGCAGCVKRLGSFL